MKEKWECPNCGSELKVSLSASGGGIVVFPSIHAVCFRCYPKLPMAATLVLRKSDVTEVERYADACVFLLSLALQAFEQLGIYITPEGTYAKDDDR